MSSSSRAQALTVAIGPLLQKMRESDSDLRTMALIDLQKELQRVTSVPVSLGSSSSLSPARRAEQLAYTDENNEREITKAVLALLGDPIAEVKNMAVSCVGAMVRRARPIYLKEIVATILTGVAASDKENEAEEGKRDISCLALKAAIVEMPVDTEAAAQSIENVINKVYPVLTKPNPDPQAASELLQILADIYTRYPHVLAAQPALQNTSLSSLTKILSSSRLSIRKRAIPALTALISAKPDLFDTIKPQVPEGLAAGGDTAKVWTAVVASLARGYSASKIGGIINDGKVVDLILGQMEDPEDIDTTEGALAALEVLVLRCPTEIGPYISQIKQKTLGLIKYDPNFVDIDDDEDDIEMNGDDEDDEDFDQDGYSDDDDVSWKVRRAAAKLLHALMGTRNELLTDFYRDSAPVVVSRMGEREESVRLEVLAAYEALLRQTAIARQAELASGNRNKRKRSQGMDEDSNPEESVAYQLQTSLPQVLRAVIKQLNGKSVPTKQACFDVLRLISEILPGGLDSDSNAILASAATAIRSIDGATASSLATSALSFLTSFFRTHFSRAYTQQLSALIPAIVRCMKDKLQRISFEAFDAASALAQSVRPKGSASPIKSDITDSLQRLFDATVQVLGDTTVDAEVREKALDTLGNLLVHEGDVFASSYDRCLPLITSRLSNEHTAGTAVIVAGRIAESATCGGPVIDNWLLDILPEIVTALRRSRRPSGKNAEYSHLAHILTRIGSQLPPKTAETMISELAPFIDQPSTLQTIGLIIKHQAGVRSSVDPLLPQVYGVVQTANSHLIEALCWFFAAYIAGDPDSATRLVPQLVTNLGQNKRIPDATRGGAGAFATTAKIVGTIVEGSPRNAAGILAEFHKKIKSSKATEADVYLGLLCIGEIGRITDLSMDMPLFENVLKFFTNESEDVRSAAAFAAGNLAVGSHKTFLPVLIQHIEKADTEASRLLLLHALKEVIQHSPTARLEVVADSLWKPLFSEEGQPTKAAKSAKGSDEAGDDGIRNVKAACIGKLTTTAPGKFLPQLQSLLHSSPRNRALVAAAVRYTFIDTSSSYDELIAPLIVEFLSLMHDDNLVVRRLSLASLNAGIQNKPHLIIDRLTTLQPLLYQETVVKKELQRTVKMGPFTIVEDDGLENRKTAYETMYTLLATCFNKIDLPTFTDRVMAALNDVNEIKVLGLMLLLRLGQLAPTSVTPRLDEVAEAVKSIMKDMEVKDDTIKQDLERKGGFRATPLTRSEEIQRSTMRTVVPLYKISTPQQAPAFHSFVLTLLNTQQWKEFRDYQG